MRATFLLVLFAGLLGFTATAEAAWHRHHHHYRHHHYRHYR